jgi:hypothetical protein
MLREKLVKVALRRTLPELAQEGLRGDPNPAILHMFLRNEPLNAY